MSSNSLSNPTPQFGTAQYAANSGAEQCKSCNQPVSGTYYRVNGVLACSNCAARVESTRRKDTHQVFVRGILFGIGGAIVGLAIYATFGIVTGLVIGFISLAVGYIVGKAIMMGSGGVGGRRYQIAAILLTYAAVSLSAIPIAIAQAIKTHPRPAVVQTSQTDPAADASANSSAGGGEGIGAALLSLTIVGLASPFLDLADPVHGIIGLVILYVGMQIAWKLTAGKAIDIQGPFAVKAPAVSPLSPGV
jgi:hypothetical protein